jgi:UDP-glucose 4-epimerase
MGSDLPIEHGLERAVNKLSRRLADTSRAHQHLGFRADTRIEDGLRKLVDWWRAERSAPTTAALAAAS